MMQSLWMVAVSFVSLVLAQQENSTSTTPQPRQLPPFHDNIVGGTPAPFGQYRAYAVPNKRTLCGAILIWEDILMTAGHCAVAFSGPGNAVHIGGTKLDGSDAPETIPVKAIVPNPNFTTSRRFGSASTNDIMLVVLSKASTAPVVEWNSDPNAPIVGEAVTVIGFGKTSSGGQVSDNLRQVNLHEVDFTACNAAYGNVLTVDSHLCAADPGKDSCFGDSGGPLFHDNSDNTTSTTVVGIVSFGSKQCASPTNPGVYTRVSTFATWISGEICCRSAQPPAGCTPSEHCTPGAPLPCTGGSGARTQLHKNISGRCVAQCFRFPSVYTKLGWTYGGC
jgi:secreted trypsin-like serine protease